MTNFDFVNFIILKTIKRLGLWIMLALSFSCNNDDDGLQSCDRSALLDADLFVSAPSQTVFLNSAEIEGDCLRINFSASGCNGETWEFNLVGQPSDAAVFPPLVNIRLILESTELCEAMISREVSFDLTVFQVSNTNSLSFQLQNNGQNLLYAY